MRYYHSYICNYINKSIGDWLYEMKSIKINKTSWMVCNTNRINHSASCYNNCRACITSSFANLNLSKLSSDIAFSSLLLASICIWILSYDITLLGFGRGALNTDCFIFYSIGFGGGGGICYYGFFYGWFFSYFIMSMNLFFANTRLLSCC